MELCKCGPLSVAERGISGGALRVVKVVEPNANQLCCNIHLRHIALISQLIFFSGEEL